LGNCNGTWHRSEAPLDAHNSPLKENSVAVDNSIIHANSVVNIPGLPGKFGKIEFVAKDVGVTVHGKHIDIYTGKGEAAERAMESVTLRSRTGTSTGLFCSTCRRIARSPVSD
jgi:3D (Asp-Asp-Asp) domain-containing protein